MTAIKLPNKLTFITKLFSDEGLTRKAYLNALASILEYGTRLLVAFITIPLMVSGLGNYYYGLWQILNRVVDYVSSTSAKPTQALKWSLANLQESDDFEAKRVCVGSAVAVWIIFFPILITAGGVLSWFLPVLLKAPPEAYAMVRITASILVLNLIVTDLAAMPRSVLTGENLGYKRMGLSAFLILIGGGFTLVALFLKSGMVGLAAVAVVTSLLGGLLFLRVVKKYSPWFGVARPSKAGIRQFLGLSSWFLVWDVINNLMLASDVIVLGLLKSVEAVTPYTLTKYVPEMLSTFVAILIVAILPGLGGIVGSGAWEKAARVRSEILSFSWLLLTFLGATILLWNGVFVRLWVGLHQFAGALPNLLIVIAVIQFAFIQNDANIINLSLKIQWKVWMGAISVGLCLGLAVLFMTQFGLGIVGLLLGFILGRLVLSLSYPVLVARFMKADLAAQIRGALRPMAVMSSLFVLAALFSDDLAQAFPLSGWQGWTVFLLSASATAAALLGACYFGGLSAQQRSAIAARIRVFGQK